MQAGCEFHYDTFVHHPEHVDKIWPSHLQLKRKVQVHFGKCTYLLCCQELDEKIDSTLMFVFCICNQAGARSQLASLNITTGNSGKRVIEYI